MNEQYEKDGYIVLRGFIPHDMAMYFQEYLNTLKTAGKMTDGDPQVEKSHCVYGDPALDTLMLMSAPMISAATGLELLPTYTYSRIYLTGAELSPHLDREECEHSMTISFGGEHEKLWPIWLMDPERHNNPQLVPLYPGDAVVYQGTKLTHWRDEFLGKTQYQAFMHFVDANDRHASRLYDGRPYIGMGADTKR